MKNNNKTYNQRKSIITLIMLLTFSSYGFSQFITGPATVTENSIETYTYDSGSLIPYQDWLVTGGTIIASGLQSGTNYYVTIQWGVTGSGLVQIRQRKWVLSELNVNITKTTFCVDTNLTNSNYVQTLVPRVPVTTITEIDQLDNSEKIESVTYFDELGRGIQNIAIRAGSNCEDVITHIDYDNYGRTEKEFLPFAEQNNGGAFKINAEAATNTFYNSTKYENTLNPFAENDLEASPLSRIIKRAAPGFDWAMGSDHEVEMEYQTNANLEVRRFETTLTYDGGANIYNTVLVLNGAYNEGELYKSLTRDENHTGTTKNHTTEEFKDAEGRVILKRSYADFDVNNDGTISGGNETAVKHDTYYVYDRHGNLSFVLPPEMKTYIGTDTAILADVNIAMDGLGYQYKYDDKNRLVEKKIPGKDWEYVVYNKLDQPILNQDANLRAQNRWLFTKYDAFGRVAYTGLTASGSDRNTLQNGANATALQWVSKSSSANVLAGTTIYYNDDANVYPNFGLDKIYTINYYDDYNFDLTGGVSENSHGKTPISNVKGLPTGSKVKILDTNDWITSVKYYDTKGRPIYIYSHNTYLNTTDKIKSKFEIDDRVSITTTRHEKTGHSTRTIEDIFDYDTNNRLLNHKQRTYSPFASPQEVIVSNVYDELGRLGSKNVGGRAGEPSLQEVDYTYSVRGWLKAINDPSSLGSDLFAFKINYNTQDHGGTPLFNGNIAETEWKTANVDNGLKWYSYDYDALNRITGATSNSINYNVSNIVYDKNGNIMNLFRRGHTNTAATIFGDMDDLTYTYAPNSNQLMKVTDDKNNVFGFRDDYTGTGLDPSDDYSYDGNGNMKKDLNKQIASISYNHLNLPIFIVSSDPSEGQIYYIYDATGFKQEKRVEYYNGNMKSTFYAGNFIYEKEGPEEVLKFFNHSEGYAKPNGANFDYVYQYKDHLGNIRLNYKNIGTVNSPVLEIQEENNYYPFGLRHKGYNNVVVSEHKYKFNGKEFEESVGLNLYEMDMRQYDPSIGRWTSIDPVTHYSMSVYNAFDNNPAYWADPSGADSQTIELQIENARRSLLDAGYGSMLTGTSSEKSKYSTYYVTNSNGDGCKDANGNPVDCNPKAQTYDNAHNELDEVFITNLDRNKYHEDFPWTGDDRTDAHLAEVYTAFWESHFEGFSVEYDKGWLGWDPNGTANVMMEWASSWILEALTAAGPLDDMLRVARAYKASKVSRGTYTVYHGIDASGNVRYVGITSRQVGVRATEHLNALGTGKEFLRYRAVPGAVQLEKQAARILEQNYINQFKLKKHGGQLFNRINSISPTKWEQNGIKL